MTGVAVLILLVIFVVIPIVREELNDSIAVRIRFKKVRAARKARSQYR